MGRPLEYELGYFAIFFQLDFTRIWHDERFLNQYCLDLDI